MASTATDKNNPTVRIKIQTKNIAIVLQKSIWVPIMMEYAFKMVRTAKIILV